MLRSKKGADKYFIYRYRYGISMFVLIVGTIVLLTYMLENLVLGISSPEAAQGLSSLQLIDILNNPINAPYKLPQWLSITIFGHSVLALRLVSVVFAAASVALLYDIFRHWHRQRIAILGSMFFVTSSWFLHNARLGTASIMLIFFVLVLLWAATRLHHAPLRRWPFFIMAGVVALSLYVPYMLYFLIAGVALHRYMVKKYLWHLNKTERTLGVIILIIFIAPLIYAFIRDPMLAKTYFGIPEILPTISEYVKQIPRTIGFIFWRAQPDAVYHLGQLPMLDIFTATVVALGIYQYEKQMNQHRTKWLFIGSVILILTLSIAGSVATFAAMAPLVYIFAATGVVSLLMQWYEIFPKNPVARAVGLLPIILLLMVVTFYHGNRYFLAWAGNPETKAAFSSDTTSLRAYLIDKNQDSVTIITPESENTTLKYSISDTTDELDISNDSTASLSSNTDLVYVHHSIELTPLQQKGWSMIDEVAVDRKLSPVSYKVYSLNVEQN